MNTKRNVLSLAIAATVGSIGTADAALYDVVLTAQTIYSNNGTSAGNLTSSTATWQYDDVSGLLTQTGGVHNMRATTAPTTTLFRHSITGLVVGAGGTSTATSFVCTEGNFGGGVGASICGNYNLGANFINESTTIWGPGTATARTIGGDDMASGDMQSLATQYNNFVTISFNGSTLIMQNASCLAGPGNCTGTGHVNGFNNGYTFTGTATLVPVPAAAWLLGPAILAAGRFARRRRKDA